MGGEDGLVVHLVGDHDYTEATARRFLAEYNVCCDYVGDHAPGCRVARRDKHAAGATVPVTPSHPTSPAEDAPMPRPCGYCKEVGHGQAECVKRIDAEKKAKAAKKEAAKPVPVRRRTKRETPRRPTTRRTPASASLGSTPKDGPMVEAARRLAREKIQQQREAVAAELRVLDRMLEDLAV